jgi:hypothetical protein
MRAIFPLESVPYWLVDAHAGVRPKSEDANQSVDLSSVRQFKGHKWP